MSCLVDRNCSVQTEAVQASGCANGLFDNRQFRIPGPENGQEIVKRGEVVVETEKKI